MTIHDLAQYEVLLEREMGDVNSQGTLLRHKKSGARVFLLSNEDENKVFYIGFRTPPKDSTGLPHILEHSVLCGSEHFPAKDPFVELAKGSLNTFLNAMTYPDKTIYPVASCNDQDFQNLVHVYLDAVFYPNIYRRKEIFMQEGWHYELDSPEDEISISGVVYNEMKGAFSSPEGVLDRQILNSLFPDNAYAFESGGDPEAIPGLSQEQFLAFHQAYYHPSNSYIYLYGDMDMAEKLAWLDSAYLSKFDSRPVDSEIRLQEHFAAPVEVRKKYSITSTEDEADNTYLSYNLVVGTSLDRELYLAFQALEYALTGSPGAALKQALLDARIGKDIMGSYDNGIRQPIFSVVAKQSNLSQKEQFLEIIQSVLKQQVREGIDKKALLAGINYYEFRYREADYGHYPKGLIYGLTALDSWLYDERDPFMHLEANEVFARLREQVDTGYFENLIEKYLLGNPHASVVIIEPEQGLTAKGEQELREKLAAYKARLSREKLEEISRTAKALKAYQEEPSSKEDLEKIPLLKVEDIGREAMVYHNREVRFGQTLCLHHDLFTNGIGYLTLCFDAKSVPEELIPYMGILNAVLGYVSTAHYSYRELSNEININTGGIHCALAAFSRMGEMGKYEAKFEIRAKALYDKLGFTFGMIREILTSSDFTDEKRLYEIIAQLKSRMQMSMNSAGHSVAAMRAMSYFSPASQYSDMTGGITFYRLVDRIERNFQQEKAGLMASLGKLMAYIFREENLMVSYTANMEGFEALEREVEEMKTYLHQEALDAAPCQVRCQKKNEGFMASAKVQYVSRAGDFIREGHAYTGALLVLKVILSYDYLWNNVRVKGGAYGCMSGFTRTGTCYFASYRDPNLEKTNEIFEGVTGYLRQFEASDRDMAKYIIGAISDLDVPLSPSAKGRRSFNAYLAGISYEDVQREREEVLGATVETIRQLADLVGAALDQNNLCVIGSEEKVKEQGQLFMEIQNLY